MKTIQALQSPQYRERLLREVAHMQNAEARVDRYVARCITWLRSAIHNKQPGGIMAVTDRNKEMMVKLFDILTKYVKTDAIIGADVGISMYKNEQGFTEIPTVKYMMQLLRMVPDLQVGQPQFIIRGDKFQVETDTTVSPLPILKHKPNYEVLRDVTPDNLIMGYVPFSYKGNWQHAIVPKVLIDNAKKAAKRDYGPWIDHYQMMAEKTCLKHAMKFMPMPVEADLYAAIQDSASYTTEHEIGDQQDDQTSDGNDHDQQETAAESGGAEEEGDTGDYAPPPEEKKKPAAKKAAVKKKKKQEPEDDEEEVGEAEENQAAQGGGNGGEQGDDNNNEVAW